MKRYDDPLSRREDAERNFRTAASGETSANSGLWSRVPRFKSIFPYIADLFSYTSSRSYGFFLLSFGVMTLLLNLAFSYFGFGQNDIVSALIVGAASSVLAIPFLISDTPFCLLLQDFVPTSVVLFDFLCIRRPPRVTAKAVLPLWFCLAFGVLLAIVGFLLPLIYLLMAIGAALFLSLSFSSPEFPLLFALLLLPYLPLTGKMPTYLAVMIGISFLSFIRKVFLGKRNFLFEKYDALLIVFVALFWISGIVNGKDAIVYAATATVLACAFPLASNLISNPRLVEAAEKVLLVSSVPIGILSLIKAFGLLDADPAFGLFLPSSALFDSPAVYARYLLPVAIVSLSLSSERRPKLETVLYFLSFLLASVNLAFTLRSNAWIALLFGILAILFLNSKKKLSPILLILTVLTGGLFLLPDRIVAAVDGIFAWSDFSLASFFASCDGMLSLMSDRFLFGVGSAFGSTLPAYLSSADATGNGGNMLLYFGCVAGAAAVIVLLALLIVRIRHRLSFHLFCHYSSLRSQNATVAATVYALFFLGMTENVGSSATDVFLFFLLFGIGNALLRISKKEYDERRAYYGNDDNSAESSVVDITIRD